MNHNGKSVLVAKWNQALRQNKVVLELILSSNNKSNQLLIQRLKIIFDFEYLKSMIILKILCYIAGEISFNAINYTISKRNYSIIPIK